MVHTLEATILTLLALLITPSLAHSPPKTHLNYTIIPNIFLQSLPSTNASSFNITTSNFGLINRTYQSDPTHPCSTPTNWQRLSHYITTLNAASAHKNTRHALVFFGRHGEGYHNAAESYFGTPAWNCYYSEQDGNASVTWADAHLTATGIQQALTINAFWNHLISDEKIKTPESYYTSPLYRCLQTANYTFSSLPLPEDAPFVPTIKELFREGISGHTCDRRSNRTYIHESFPGYRFEKGFQEYDPYFEALHGETQVDQDSRSKAVLDEVFAGDGAEVISVTAHSGEIASLLRVIGHRAFSLSTGSAIPVLIKITTLKGEPAPSTTQAYTLLPTCTAPPTIRDASCDDCSCCN